VYAWIWRRLPGRWPAKLVGLLVLLLVVLALLFLVVFPTVGPALPFNHVTVDSPTPSPSAAALR
jgi:uncharacterized BrkB/YihY/UPF0761 family membrane protein